MKTINTPKKNQTAKHILILFLFLLSVINAQQDVVVKLNETQLNEALATVIDARGVNFGDYTGSIIPEAWFVNLDGGIIYLKTGNEMTIHASFVATAVNIDGVYNNITVHPTLDIDGSIRLDPASDGYKLVFDPQGIRNFEAIGEFYDNLIEDHLTEFINKIPEIELNIGTKLLPAAITNYFTTTIPILNTTEDEIIISFSISGTRKIDAYNEVNQKVTIGNIEEVVNGIPLSPYTSPQTFWWNPSTTHQLQTSSPLLDETNGKNKYLNWLDDATGFIQPETAPRRFQLTVTQDATYKAKFVQAQHVQLSNLLEGSFSGGTVTYEYSPGISATGTTFNDYDYNYSNNPVQHPINTTVPNGTLGANWLWQGWSDGNTSAQRNIVLDADKNLIANYKTTHLSNTSTAFANNGQRKVVETTYYEDLFMTYESMGKVWLEKGAGSETWSLVNNGKSLGGLDAKSPSIARVQLGDDPIFVVYQQKTSNGKYQIILDKYNVSGSLVYSTVVYVSDNDYATKDAMPVIGATIDTDNSGDIKVLLVWKENTTATTTGGLYYRGGIDRTSSLEWKSPNAERIGYNTTNNATTPTIAVDRYIGYNNAFKFHLAWEENWAIKYAPLTFGYSGVSIGAPSDISSNHYAQKHMNPSIIEINGGARIVWRSEYDVDGNGEWISPCIVFRDPGYYAYWNFGNYTNVHSPVINKPDDNSAYFLGWTENNGAYGKIADNHLSASYTRTIPVTGKDMQICSGWGPSAMYALQFNNASLPYTFNRSNSIASYYGLQKQNSNASISVARTGVAIKEKGKFFYSLGDIYVDNGLIEFEELDRNNTLATKENLTNSIISKPFVLGSTSSLTYSVTYGMNNMTKGKEALGDNGEIHFRVEVLDANTNEVLGSFDEMKYSKMNLAKYSNIGYKVNAPGLLGKSIKLRLHADDNLDAKYVIVENMQTGTSLAKKTFKEVELKQNEVVTDYGLGQNYPNPFNPATTITYQLPKSGSVTLKIYDMLGKEVITLVNEQKEMGRYTVQFDASSLASGMYVYQLRANDYTSTKKMLLLK